MARAVTADEYVIPLEVAGQEPAPPSTSEGEDFGNMPEAGDDSGIPEFRSSLAEAASTYEGMSDDQLAEVRNSAPLPRRIRPEGEAATPEDFRRACINLAHSHLEATEGEGESRRMASSPLHQRRVVEGFGADDGDWGSGGSDFDDDAPSDPLEAAIYYAGLVADYQEQAQELLELAARAQARQAECLLEIARQEG